MRLNFIDTSPKFSDLRSPYSMKVIIQYRRRMMQKDYNKIVHLFPYDASGPRPPGSGSLRHDIAAGSKVEATRKEGSDRRIAGRLIDNEVARANMNHYGYHHHLPRISSLAPRQ